MFHKQFRFVVLVLLPVLYCQVVNGHDRRDVWTERVLTAAQYLTGRWEVEGEQGNDRWQGEWSCKLVPGKMVYIIMCSGARVDRDEPTHHATRLRGVHPRNGRFFECSYPPASGAVMGPVRRASTSQIKVTRHGPDEFTWVATSTSRAPLTIRFRRMREE